MNAGALAASSRGFIKGHLQWAGLATSAPYTYGKQFRSLATPATKLVPACDFEVWRIRLHYFRASAPSFRL
jgi:hypothetical protein